MVCNCDAVHKEAFEQGREEAKREIAEKIAEISQVCADGYRRAISQFNTVEGNELQTACSTAASNVGWFLLDSLGFSKEQKRELFDKYRAEASTVSDDRSQANASEVVR